MNFVTLFGALIVSPIWGIASTWFLIQGWLGVIYFVIAAMGFVKGAVPRKDTAVMMVVAVAIIVLFSLLLRGGYWLLSDVLPFGYTTAENVIYWSFAILSAIAFLVQVPSKIALSWKYAMAPGAFNMDLITERLKKL